MTSIVFAPMKKQKKLFFDILCPSIFWTLLNFYKQRRQKTNFFFMYNVYCIYQNRGTNQQKISLSFLSMHEIFQLSVIHQHKKITIFIYYCFYMFGLFNKLFYLFDLRLKPNIQIFFGFSLNLQNCNSKFKDAYPNSDCSY